MQPAGVNNYFVFVAAAVVFYIFYWFYMVLITFVSPAMGLVRLWCHQRSMRRGSSPTVAKYEAVPDMREKEEEDVQQTTSLLQFVKEGFTWGLTARQLLTIVCGIDLIVFIILSKLL